MSEYNDKFMTLAFTKAEEALTVGEVPIGCVFVGPDGKIIAQTRNTVNQTKNATRHAEINAIDIVATLAGEDGKNCSDIYPTISVYVNVEPCIMCAAALLQVKVADIFYGCANDKFGGCGSVGDIEGSMAWMDPEYKVNISGGHRSEEAIKLLKDFYDGLNPNAPNPKVKGQKVKKSPESSGGKCSKINGD